MMMEKRPVDRRTAIKAIAAGGTGLAVPVNSVAARQAEQLEGVAYDLQTHNILRDASATVARSAAGIRGRITVGKRAIPINVGKPERVNEDAGRSDSTRFQTTLGGKHAVQGVDTKQYFVNTPECLAGIVREFNPNRPTNFDGVGYCLMKDYEAARKTIEGDL